MIRKDGPALYRWLPRYTCNKPADPTLVIPLWLPLAIIGIPTFLAWRRDYPLPANHPLMRGYNRVVATFRRTAQVVWIRRTVRTIHVAVIVVLTLGAIVTGSLAATITVGPLRSNPWRIRGISGYRLPSGHVVSVSVGRGHLYFSAFKYGEQSGRRRTKTHPKWIGHVQSRRERLIGLAVRSTTNDLGNERVRGLIGARFVWGVAILLAIYPTLAFIRGPLRHRRRRRLRKHGLCLGCGYDLTGNESGVCPECGTEVAP